MCLLPTSLRKTLFGNRKEFRTRFPLSDSGPDDTKNLRGDRFLHRQHRTEVKQKRRLWRSFSWTESSTSRVPNTGECPTNVPSVDSVCKATKGPVTSEEWNSHPLQTAKLPFSLRMYDVQNHPFYRNKYFGTARVSTH